MAKHESSATEQKSRSSRKTWAGSSARQGPRRKAGWGQRKQITKHLEEIRDTASHLLTELGHEAQAAVRGARAGYGKRGPGRPPAGPQAPEDVAEARAKIAAAQKKRWAKVKAAQKK